MKRIFNDDLTGEFANDDDDDEGGDLFKGTLKDLEGFDDLDDLEDLDNLKDLF